jgi:hypothetical protein
MSNHRIAGDQTETQAVEGKKHQQDGIFLFCRFNPL